MPKKGQGNRGGTGGEPAAGKWQVDNVNRARDNRRVLAKRRDKAANKASRQHQKANAKAANKSGCAVTAIAAGLALASAAARLRGWLS